MFIFFLLIAADRAVSPREVIVHSIDQVRVFLLLDEKYKIVVFFCDFKTTQSMEKDFKKI